jgi:hypothetical protein
LSYSKLLDSSAAAKRKATGVRQPEAGDPQYLDNDPLRDLRQLLRHVVRRVGLDVGDVGSPFSAVFDAKRKIIAVAVLPIERLGYDSDGTARANNRGSVMERLIAALLALAPQQAINHGEDKAKSAAVVRTSSIKSQCWLAANS